DKETRAGAAALALVEEEGEVRAFDGFVHIGVGENDVGALAAELERDALEVGISSGAHDEVADFRGAGEGDFVYIHVTRDGGACGETVAGENVYDAWGT